MKKNHGFQGPPQRQASNGIQEKLQQALALHQRGMLSDATKIYQAILKQRPKHFDALHLLGVVACQTNNPHQAVELIGRAIKVDPNVAATYSNRGNALKDLRRLDEAVASYDKAIALKPDYVEAYINRGTALQDLKRLGEAIISYDKAIVLKPNYAEAYNNRGNALKDLKRFDEAIASYEKAIALKPNYAEAYYNYGTVLKDLKRLDEAIISYDKAIALMPNYADAHYNRGNALQDLRRLDEAVTSYEKAIVLKPDYAEAYYNHGIALQNLKRFDEAIASYEKAIALKLDLAKTWLGRGNVLKDLKRFDDAIASYEEVIALNPDYAEAYYNRGIALQDLKRFDDAIASYEKAIALKTDYVEAYYNRGNALKDLKRFGEAIASYEKAIGLNPDYAEAYLNCGNALALQDKRYEEALAAYDEALALKPDFGGAWLGRGNIFHDLGRDDEAIAAYDNAIALEPDLAEAHSSRGVVFQERMQLETAIANYDKAIAIKPDYATAYWNKSLVLLLLGDFEGGWSLFEWRWEIRTFQSSKRNFLQPLWLGNESLVGKTILLHSEQGLGDTIQFCRYAKLVADLGANVILQVQKPLMNLVARCHGVAQIAAEGSSLPPFDYQCPLMSLPLAFKTNLSNAPSDVSYLKSDPEKSRFWKEKLGEKNKLRVGLVWSGGFRPNQPEVWSTNNRRNIPLRKLAALNFSDIEFYSLQKGQPAESELAESIRDNWGGPEIFDFTNLLHDFLDTASLIENLDLVISVDTSTAHLAGALGKPVWILNRFDTDWRWLLDRSDSPWYPTVKLYRQEKAGEWDDVVQRVKADLIGFRLSEH